MKKRDVNIRKLSVPFANTGIKTPIPLTTQPDGKVSYEKGYTDLYQKAKKAGGLQLLLGNHNQILNDITSDTIANSDDLLALEGEVEGIINKLDNSTPKLLTQNLEWVVGSGVESDTHFNDLQIAINEASKYQPCNGFNFITIKLKTEFVWNKLITIPTGSNLSFVKIISETLNNCSVNNTFLRGSECITPYIGVKLTCIEGAKIVFNRSTVRFLDTIKIDNLLYLAFHICQIQIDGGELNLVNNTNNPLTLIIDRSYGYIYSKIKINYNYTNTIVRGYLINNTSGKILMNNDITLTINANPSSNISGFGFSRTVLDIDAGNKSTIFTTNCLGCLYSVVFETLLNTHQNIVMNGTHNNICFLFGPSGNKVNIYDIDKINLGNCKYTNITPGTLSPMGQFIRLK